MVLSGSFSDHESTQTGELEPSNPDILCRELQMKNCAGVFFVVIMFKQLSDEEDDSNHTGLICSNNAYPKVDQVIPCLPWPLRSTADFGSNSRDHSLPISNSHPRCKAKQNSGPNLPKLTTANLVAVSLTTLEFTRKEQFPLSHFVLAFKCRNRKF